jgi:L-seryl-tRNA(Ser) seleniumtransferase
MGDSMPELSCLPSVEILLQTKFAEGLISKFGRALTIHSIREVLNGIRKNHEIDKIKKIPRLETILEQVNQNLETFTRPSLRPVINATGVILHTNLGRAPLSQASIQAMKDIADGYSNLEFDLVTGKRGSRLIHAEKLLQLLLGVESALVVNNNASSVLLILSALATRKRVVISRTQLVEIGGGFRIPDVMRQSGARLVEIGTTNRVHLGDYEQALQEPASLVMRVHRSNFIQLGFTSEPMLTEIIRVAHLSGVPLMDDLGSGALLMTERFGLAHEPTVQESLAAGVDLVCFSGDKLVGGPQAGIIVGRSDLVQKLKKHPLARAVRADKFCLAALSATLLHYLKEESEHEIPIWRMISSPSAQIRTRAKKWVKQLQDGEVMEGLSTIGGGSLPGETLPTWLMVLDVRNPDRFLGRLRSLEPAIIARTENDRILFDPRTVLPEEDEIFLAGIRVALKFP